MKKGIIVAASVLAVVSIVWAVSPVTWSHSTEAQFASGKLSKTVITPLGEVKLSRALETIVKPAKEAGIISAMVIDRRGKVYVAAAPKATIYRVDGDKLVKFAELPGVLIRSMVFVGDKLVAGTCGKDAGIYQIDRKGKVKKIWTDKKVASVWSVLPGPRGSFYAATGAEGKIYHVKSDGKAEVIYDSDEKNILSLTASKKGDLLYAGSGEKGLIIELTPAKKKGRILYDADEAEISCLIVGPDGTLYAATSDSSKASANGEAPSNHVKGKPAKPKAKKPAGKTTTRPTTRPAKKKPVTTAPAKRADKKASELELLKKSLVKPDSKSAGSVNKGDTQARPMRLIRGKSGKFRIVGASAPQMPTKSAPTPRQIPPEILRRMMSSRRSSTPSRPTPSSSSGKGNAVYRIGTDGFVQTIFRRPITILAMVMRDGVLMLGTGHGGQVFTVNTDGEQIYAIAKLDPKDITALASDSKGRLYMGTAGNGGVFVLGKGFEKKGTIISKVFTAKQIAGWGTMNVSAEIPAGCGVTIATRSGNVAKPDEKTWSDWSIETIVGAGWLPIASPAGRFLQYRLTLAGEGKATPSVNRVTLVHQVGNIAPAVSAVQVAAGSGPKPGTGAGGPMRFRTIQAKASDPNGDKMQFAFYFRRVGREKWIKLLDKSPKPMYAWDTQAVPDGPYEVRVEVTDAPSNAPSAAMTAARISRQFLADNTKPVVADLVAKPLADGRVRLTGKTSDALSRIRRIYYAVDSNKEWHRLLPEDGICDSQNEKFSTTITDLEEGAHRIAVRVVDKYNNTAYASVEVTVGK